MLLILFRYSTVLLKLAPGQEVSFEFIARRGIGKARHTPLMQTPHPPRPPLLPHLTLLTRPPLLTLLVSDARQVVSSGHRGLQIRSRRSVEQQVPSRLLFLFTPNPSILFSKLDRLSADTRREWTQSCPTRVFSFNEITQVLNIQHYNRLYALN